MDADRFDDLARARRGTPPRRVLLGTALAGALTAVAGRLGVFDLDDAAAKERGKGRGKGNGKGNGKSDGNGQGNGGGKGKDKGSANTTSPPPPTALPPTPNCSDAVRNGAETDVDCGGGACKLCRAGQSCYGRTDCETGLCRAGAAGGRFCFECAQHADCGNDAIGRCSCSTLVSGGKGCHADDFRYYRSCAECPAGTICYRDDRPGGGGLFCAYPCGARG